MERLYFLRDNERKKGEPAHLKSFAVEVIIMENINTSEKRLCPISPCGPIGNHKVQSMTINCIQKQQSAGGRCAQIMDL